ncbi:unnamed protein product [Rhizophagus irregularis]|nr:unnamed protein product [Rhizophagus irregularis]CAB5387666.1 unnamed protein product [Rhizophagus irregularis]
MPATTESSKSSKREYPAILKLYTYCPLLNDKGCSIRRNDKKRNAKEKRQEEKCDVNPFRYKRQEEKRQEEKRQEEKRDANYRCLVSGGAPGIGKTWFGRDFFLLCPKMEASGNIDNYQLVQSAKFDIILVRKNGTDVLLMIQCKWDYSSKKMTEKNVNDEDVKI